MTEYELQFRWNLTVEAENLQEAKKTAPDVLLDHLRQVRLEPQDFFDNREGLEE